MSDTAARTSRANGEPHQRLPSRGFRNGRRAILSMSANGRGKMIFAARHPATDIREAPVVGGTQRALPSSASYLPTLAGTSSSISGCRRYSHRLLYTLQRRIWGP